MPRIWWLCICVSVCERVCMCVCVCVRACLCMSVKELFVAELNCKTACIYSVSFGLFLWCTLEHVRFNTCVCPLFSLLFFCFVLCALLSLITVVHIYNIYICEYDF